MYENFFGKNHHYMGGDNLPLTENKGNHVSRPKGLKAHKMLLFSTSSDKSLVRMGNSGGPVSPPIVREAPGSSGAPVTPPIVSTAPGGSRRSHEPTWPASLAGRRI
jgi:hypothetical protein